MCKVEYNVSFWPINPRTERTKTLTIHRVIQHCIRIIVATNLNTITNTDIKPTKISRRINVEISSGSIERRNNHIVIQLSRTIFNHICKWKFITKDIGTISCINHCLWCDNTADIKCIRGRTEKFTIGPTNINGHLLQGRKRSRIVFLLAFHEFGNHS